MAPKGDVWSALTRCILSTWAQVKRAVPIRYSACSISVGLQGALTCIRALRLGVSVANQKNSGASVLFSMRELAHSAAHQTVLLKPGKASRIPSFLVQKQPAASSLSESLRVVCARNTFAQLPPSLLALVPFRKAFLEHTRLARDAFGLALALHCLVAVGLFNAPLILPAKASPLAAAYQPPETLFYVVPEKPTETEVPPVAPPDVAGRPNDGSQPDVTPAQGTAFKLGNLTAVSKPMRPDNRRQTIIQSASPPDLLITQDVKLPNIIMGNLSQPTRPALTFPVTVMPKPEQTNRNVPAAAAPVVDRAPQSNPLPLGNVSQPARPAATYAATAMPKPVPTNSSVPGAAAPVVDRIPQSNPLALGNVSQPARPAATYAATAMPKPVPTNSSVPAAAAPTLDHVPQSNPLALGNVSQPARPAATYAATAMPKPEQTNRNVPAGSAPVVDHMAQNNPLPLLAGSDPAGASPQLPVPVGALQKPVLQARAGSSGPSTQDAQNIVNNVNASASSGGNGLLSISVDPSADASKIAVPPGNRYGEFSIAPASTPGSPGGNPKTGEVGGGPGSTSGPGGEGSKGVGTGGPGGGGDPASMSVGPISVKGTMTATEQPLVLIGSVPAEMVYPLPLDVIAKLRKNRMVISSGSIGGGGLDVYGALACGKIYTIFLPMPGANWTMQFCEKSNAAASDKPAPQAKVVQLEPPLVPPDPDSDARFDFKRLPVPPEKAHKMIVLKGVLGEDGTVANLEVYQGVLAEMDQAAQLAFSRWKFKPAMRADKPVSVEILVGIPTQVPAASTSGPQQQQR